MQNLEVVNEDNNEIDINFIESNIEKGVCVIGKFLLLEKTRVVSKGRVSYKLSCTQIRTARFYTIFAYNSELFDIEEGKNYTLYCFLNSAHGYFLVLNEYNEI